MLPVSAGVEHRVSALRRTERTCPQRLFFTVRLRRQMICRASKPVYGFYAGNDVRIDATIPDTIAAMKAAGKTYDPVTYEGAGHGFMRVGEAPDATDANKKARDESWKRWKSLLAK